MEGKLVQVDDAPLEEETPDLFLCCICLDLLYKPVVLSCGHMACFWCVHISMSGIQDSHCPICRSSYKHFPSICQTLHFLLLKLYPVAYIRREKQTLAEEKERNCFSPQFCHDVPESSANHGCDNVPACSVTGGSECPPSLDHQSTSKGEACPSECHPSLDHQSTGKGEACPSITLESGISSTEQTKYCKSSEGIHFGDKNLAPERTNQNGKQLSVADALCVACKQMLYRPVVLNCGHAYCEACILDQVNGVLRCQVCQYLHPSAYPKVCLEFDHFLEMQFPKEYAQRRDSAQTSDRDIRTDSINTSRSDTTVNDGSPVQSAATQEHRPEQSDSILMVHTGAGCDFCGMYPITGDRYRCQDCVEAVGFDLCGDCYNIRSNLPGRFNQQHRRDHRFERIDGRARHFIPQLLAAGSRGFSINFSGPYGVPELSENEFPVVTLASDDSESPGPETDDEENQDGAH